MMVDIFIKFIWNFVSFLFSKGITLLSFIIVSRVLGTNDFGVFGYIFSTYNMIASVGGLAFGVTATKYISSFLFEDRSKVPGIIRFLELSALIFSALSLCFLYVSWDLIFASSNVPGLFLVYPLVVVGVLIGLQFGIIAGFQGFKSLAKISVFQGVLSLPLTFVLTHKLGLQGALLSLFLGQVFSCCINQFVVYRLGSGIDIPQGGMGVFKNKFYMLKRVTFPSFLSGIAYAPTLWFANFALLSLVDGTTHVGMFSAVNQWRVVLGYFPLIMGTVLLPKLSQVKSGLVEQELDTLNVLITWIPVCLLSFVLITFPGLVLEFFGDGFDGVEMSQSLSFLMAACCVNAYKSSISRKFITGEMGKISLYSNFSWSFLFILTLPFVVEYGAPGVCFGFLFSQIIHFVLWIPFYISKNIVPRNLITSIDCLAVWIGMLIILSVNICFELSYWYKIPLLFIVVMPLLYMPFSKVKSIDKQNQLLTI